MWNIWQKKINELICSLEILIAVLMRAVPHRKWGHVFSGTQDAVAACAALTFHVFILISEFVDKRTAEFEAAAACVAPKMRKNLLELWFSDFLVSLS